MVKNPTRIPKEKVFVRRELSKEVIKLTTAKVIQRDHWKIKRYVKTSQQRHRKRVQPSVDRGKFLDKL